MNPVEWAVANLSLVLTGLLALFLIAWAYDAWEDAEDRREAASGFAGNLKSGTGGVLNVVLVSIVGAVGALAATFSTVSEAAAWLFGLVPDVPVLAAGVFGVSLGGLSLSGLLELHPLQYVGIAGTALVLAVAYRVDWQEVDL